MEQHREFLLYIGRNARAAAQLHRMLVDLLRPPGTSWRPAGNGASDSAPADSGNRSPRERAPAESEGLPGTGALVEAGTDPFLPIAIVSSQKAALRFVQSTPTRVVVVETGTKPASRHRFCDSLRQRLSSVCIVAIVPRSALGSYNFLFDAVVSTPLRVADLLPVAEMVRGGMPDTVITRGVVTLNTLTRTVSSPKGEFGMTPKQCELLTMLMRQSDVVVHRAEIMQTIWKTSYLADTRTLDVHVHWLRHMIESDPSQPKMLVTRRGVGYQFVVPDTP